MTTPTPAEQTTDEQATPEPTGPKPGSALYAPPISAEDTQNVFSRLERQDREFREHRRTIDDAWQSQAAKKISVVIREDGNVDFREFVGHCGGILNVVAMVDEFGLPDTDQIIPKVDELFNKTSEQEFQGGVVFRRHPGNRPYVAGRGTSAGEAKFHASRAQFPGDRDPGEGEAEQMLQDEQERAARPRTTHAR